MSAENCALCGSKILDDDVSVACTRCDKWMCAFCAEATEQCCAVAEVQPVLLPADNLSLDREVERLTFQVVAVAAFLLVLPFLQLWLYEQNCKMAMERMTPEQYSEWNQEYIRKFMMN